MKKILSCLLTAALLISVTSCSQKAVTNTFREGTYYDYFVNEIDMPVEGSAIQGSAYGSDFSVGCFMNYSDEYRLAEDIWNQNQFTSNKTYLPVTSDGNVITPDRNLGIYDFEGNLISSANINETKSNSVMAPKLFVDPFDNIHVLTEEMDVDTGDTTFFDLVYSKSGELVSETMLDIESGSYIADFGVDTEKNIYVYASAYNGYEYSDTFYKFSSEGELINTSSPQGGVYTFTNVGEDLYCLIATSENFVFVEAFIKTEDFMNDNLDAKITLPEEYCEVNTIRGVEGGVLFRNNSELMLLDIETNEISLIVDFNLESCPVYPYNYSTNSDGDLIFMGNDSLTSSWYMVTMSATDTDPFEGREKLILAGVNIIGDPIVHNMVALFNINNPEYYIEVKDYVEPGMSEEELALSYDSLYQTMLDDISYSHISGEAPDMVIDPGNHFSFYTISGSDFLLPLNTYVQSLENELLPWFDTEEEFFFMPMACRLEGLTIPEDISDLDYESYENLALASGFTAESIQTYYGQQYYLKEMVGLRMRDFFDVSTHEVNFDSDEFINLLMWIKDNVMPEGMWGESFAEAGVIYSNSFNTEGMSFLGFPTENGSLIAAVPEYTFAITADCQNPDVCWEFLSMGFDTTYQSVFGRVECPMTRAGLESSVDENFTDSEVGSSYRNFAENVNAVYMCDMEIINVVTEEAGAYFAGERSASDVADYIQNRAELIMDERY